MEQNTVFHITKRNEKEKEISFLLMKNEIVCFCSWCSYQHQWSSEKISSFHNLPHIRYMHNNNLHRLCHYTFYNYLFVWFNRWFNVCVCVWNDNFCCCFVFFFAVVDWFIYFFPVVFNHIHRFSLWHRWSNGDGRKFNQAILLIFAMSTFWGFKPFHYTWCIFIWGNGMHISWEREWRTHTHTRRKRELVLFYDLCSYVRGCAHIWLSLVMYVNVYRAHLNIYI